MTTKTSNPRPEKTGPIRLASYLPGNNPALPPVNLPARPLIGILEGTGIGPQVINATLQVLKSVEQAMNLRFEVRHGGLIGEKAVASCGKWLPEDTWNFALMFFESEAPSSAAPVAAAMFTICGGVLICSANLFLCSLRRSWRAPAELPRSF